MILILQKLLILSVRISIWTEALLLEVSVGAVIAADAHSFDSGILVDVSSDLLSFWLY